MPYEDLPNNTGKVLPSRHVAVYRDPAGELHAVSSVCTHMGCDVLWNDQNKVWVCPCHGSSFAPAGGVINGPATEPLDAAPVPE